MNNTGVVQRARRDQTSLTNQECSKAPGFHSFKLFLEQTSSLRASQKEKRRAKGGQTNSSLHHHGNLPYNHPDAEDTSWEVQGKKLTFTKCRGVSCRSAAIRGSLAGLPPHQSRDLATPIRESKPMGNCFYDLSDSVF